MGSSLTLAGLGWWRTSWQKCWGRFQLGLYGFFLEWQAGRGRLQGSEQPWERPSGWEPRLGFLQLRWHLQGTAASVWDPNVLPPRAAIARCEPTNGNECCLKPLNLGVICYTVTEREWLSRPRMEALQPRCHRSKWKLSGLCQCLAWPETQSRWSASPHAQATAGLCPHVLIPSHLTLAWLWPQPGIFYLSLSSSLFFVLEKLPAFHFILQFSKGRISASWIDK